MYMYVTVSVILKFAGETCSRRLVTVVYCSGESYNFASMIVGRNSRLRGS
jgi:hypothetical protein